MHVIYLFIAAILVLASCKKDESKAPAKESVEEAAQTPAIPTTTENAPLLERGEYLAGLMGCEHCHTPFAAQGPDQSKRYAGGLEVPEAFGTWRSLNITQDKATGIGDWTDKEIIDAIREGKRPDGEQLFPIMPYLFYNTLSDDDAKALVAYLRKVEPVAHKVERKLDLKMPKIPAPPASGDAPSHDNPVAYGQYLTAIMHCAACHTPMGPEGLDMSKAFAGGMKLEVPMMGEGALYSSNLTPDPETGIGEWSDEEIVASLKQMKKRDGSMILGPMALYQGGWYALEDKDVDAIVAFLRSLPPMRNEVPKSTFKPHAAPQ